MLSLLAGHYKVHVVLRSLSRVASCCILVADGNSHSRLLNVSPSSVKIVMLICMHRERYGTFHLFLIFSWIKAVPERKTKEYGME